MKNNIIVNATYEEMENFILNNVEYTYNIKKCLNDFIGNMEGCGILEDVFYMADDEEHFKIRTHHKILKENTEAEEIVLTYDVEKIQ